MNIQEYLKQCSVKSVDELTDEQVVDYYTKGNAGIAQKMCGRISPSKLFRMRFYKGSDNDVYS